MVAGFKNTLLRCLVKLEVVYGYEKEILPGIQARGGEDGQVSFSHHRFEPCYWSQTKQISSLHVWLHAAKIFV